MDLRVKTLDRGRGEERGIRGPGRAPDRTEISMQKEYMRAVKEVKLDYLFAKPFVAGLAGHLEGVTKICRSATELNAFASLSYDGGVCVWDMSKRALTHKIAGGERAAAVSFYDAACPAAGSSCILTGKGKRVTLRALGCDGAEPKEEYSVQSGAIDICQGDEGVFFVSTSEGIEVFDGGRIQSIGEFKTGGECKRVRWNESYAWMVHGVCGNRVEVYDRRADARAMCAWANTEVNSISVDPSNGHQFAAALDSGELKVYDMRYLRDGAKGTEPSRVYRGHASPALDVSYSADGRRIVSGSSDRTVRIFSSRLVHRQEQVYHNRRMQAVNAVCSSGDASYIVSGSTDGNVRVWKADANMPLKVLTPQEAASRASGALLKDKFRDLKEIEDLRRHKVLPKRLKAEMRNRYEHLQAIKRREARRGGPAK